MKKDQEWKLGGCRNPGGVDQVLVWRLHKMLESAIPVIRVGTQSQR